MNRSVVLRRLCWKEFRQLLPLVVMLAAIGLVLQVLLLISQPQHTSLTQNLFFSGLPGLFAAGVGALLVGQERDSRTLFWMASLPILKQDIIRVKFLAGIAGLASVWIVSIALFLVSNGFTSLKPELDIASGILYSIFLLFVSFATAWTFRSTFVSLLVLVSVAMSYTITGNLLTQAKSSDFFTIDFSMTIVLVAISALSLWLGWIAALRALGPTAPDRFTQPAISGVTFFDRSIVDRRTIQSPWSALIWQFAAQNRAMLAGLTLLYLLPLCIGSFAIILNRAGSSSVWIEAFPRFGFIISFVSISWLGVVTFQGDNLNQRIRFLSDRGISPRTIWLTRQTVPIGMLIVGTIALAVAVSTVHWAERGTLQSDLGLLLLVSSVLMWTIYAVTQWMSQIVRSPVIAAIIAPIVACLPFAYGAFALETLESPIWILAITSCIPILATVRMTRHWMDSKMGMRFWMEHGGWLALVVLLPAIPFLIVYSTYPSMPMSEWKAFSADAKRLRSYDRQPTEIKLLTSKDPTSVVVPMDLANENDLAGGEATIAEVVGDRSMESGYGQQNILPQNLTLAEERELQFEFIERQLHSVNKNTPVSAYGAGQRMMAEAMLVRARIQDDGTSEELLKRYQRSIRSIIRIIEGTRVTPHLDAQQNADRYEAWLVKELQSQGASEFLGTELRRTAAMQLGDKVGRQNARYRALVVDWAASQSSTKANGKRKSNSSSSPDHTLGKYTIPTNGNGTRLISNRHVSTVAWRMKQYLMANDSATMDQAKEAIAREWNVPTSELSSTPTTLSTNARSTVYAPWSFWFGDWEKQADTYTPSNPSATGR